MHPDLAYRLGHALLGLVLLLAAPLPLAADPPHAYSEIRIHNAAVEKRLAEWHIRAAEHEKALQESGHPALVRWSKQLAAISFNEELAGLKQFNRFINSDVVYRDDFSHYHRKDYWADPETTLEEGGDCEDIALLKAGSLQHLGWPDGRMHLLVGYLTERGRPEPHAVLLVETRDGRQHILRSIGDEVVDPAHYRFLPVYAVDDSGTLVVKPAFQ